jgi:hypothetical protein
MGGQGASTVVPSATREGTDGSGLLPLPDPIATFHEPGLHSARLRRHAASSAGREPVHATWRNTPSVETGPRTRGVPPAIPVLGATDKPLVRVR